INWKPVMIRADNTSDISTFKVTFKRPLGPSLPAMTISSQENKAG
ncbi:5399_t:CDS:1, partial [Funneliformis geosporum]